MATSRRWVPALHCVVTPCIVLILVPTQSLCADQPQNQPAFGPRLVSTCRKSSKSRTYSLLGCLFPGDLLRLPAQHAENQYRTQVARLSKVKGFPTQILGDAVDLFEWPGYG
ncbi:hypothetical protein BU16DRAFT_224855 [Lophium mytilinum]|uniref:Secreted protein n=1 Tax=Lophium mytilinum TaxID=390894 RepID=A0A6A6Q8L7_9PEZI|nr:hypothetical protein BU16DRAFT_224855 [Lophium mytilinum]